MLFTMLSFIYSLPPLFQDPAPTPSPQWMQVITLQPGVELLLERRISYGDVAIVVGMMALAFIILGITFMQMPKIWRTPR
jgi:hypothetical protein